MGITTNIFGLSRKKSQYNWFEVRGKLVMKRKNDACRTMQQSLRTRASTESYTNTIEQRSGFTEEKGSLWAPTSLVNSRSIGRKSTRHAIYDKFNGWNSVPQTGDPVQSRTVSTGKVRLVWKLFKKFCGILLRIRLVSVHCRAPGQPWKLDLGLNYKLQDSLVAYYISMKVA